MSDTAIKVENLSKRYRIGVKEKVHDTLSGALASWIKAPFSNFERLRKLSRFSENGHSDDVIWALKDVSFDVKHGEVVGIIGRNGAGKSTLLKIISRITEPTSGRVVINGRVSSLLEVGTGFHMDLTGRENVYLNGAVLGMSKREIDRKFDEIIAFAEVEKFIDTPVKRYSSGMKVRLAFAVAAHLEPEVLLVDEVLAVGDLAFQKKCIGRMDSVAREGRTVLFVSHNMIALRNLCARAIWMQGGVVLRTGNTAEIVDEYLRTSLSVDETLEEVLRKVDSLPPDPYFRLRSVMVGQNGRESATVGNGAPTHITVQYKILQRITGLRVYFDLLDDEENILIRTFHDEDQDGESVSEPGEYISTAVIPANLLAPQLYRLRVSASIDSRVHQYHCCLPGGVCFPLNVEWTSKVNRSRPSGKILSKFQPYVHWRTERITSTTGESKARTEFGGLNVWKGL